MNPKEKAKELFDKYVELSGIFVGDYESEKEMALIAVDEIIKSTFSKKWYKKNKIIPADYLLTEYWEDVQREIQKL
jgi:hypothetical protein